MASQEGYFVGYTTTIVYRIYFPDTRKVKIIRDLEFVGFGKNDDPLQVYKCDVNTFYFLDVAS